MIDKEVVDVLGDEKLTQEIPRETMAEFASRWDQRASIQANPVSPEAAADILRTFLLHVKIMLTQDGRTLSDSEEFITLREMAQLIRNSS